MNRQTRMAAVLVVLPIALSGCSVMRTLGLAPKRGEAAAAQALNSTRSVPADNSLTKLGRAQLDEGNPGLASATFRKALESEEPRAPALNGLAVAYAKIGRADLAATYFRLATEADPGNEDYARNLALLLRNSTTEHQSAKVAERPLPAPAAGLPEAGKLVRLSPREFSIHIVTPTEAPARASTAMVRIDLEKVPHGAKIGELSKCGLTR